MANKKKKDRIETINKASIKDGDQIRIKEYRHQFAIDIIQQSQRNIELEIASKKKAMTELMSDQSLPQEPVTYMGIKIRRMQTEFNRLERSKNLLLRNNREVKESSHSIARRDGKIK